MRHDITIKIAPDVDIRKESAKLSLQVAGQTKEAVLDINAVNLLKVSRTVPDLAQDFLCIASCIYAADKAIARDNVDDKWTRHLAIEIPVEHVAAWNAVAESLSECVGFLTGDRWEISFRHGEKRLIQKTNRKRRIRYERVSGDAVCLFSGGLDSFIGAVDWLTEHPNQKLLLVAHYDGDVSGPAADQRNLMEICARKFPGRFEFVQTRIGLSSGSEDANFRSRSLLFIAMGCYFAELLGSGKPVLIPENGPIALNYPLTPSRRGSCSTRTVHPHFISAINHVLTQVGIHNAIGNPYEFKTKGEMVNECKDQAILRAAFALTRSCAKSNRRGHWIVKKCGTGKAPLGCGICIPCLFRRASLHKNGFDSEAYGIPIEIINDFEGAARADLLALVAFLRNDFSDREIAAGLLSNGDIRFEHLSSYVDLVKRMRSEVLTWLKAKGSQYIKNQIRAC